MTFPDKIFTPERYAYKDYELWEGDWELINGYPVAMSPSPNRKHQGVTSDFIWRVKNAMEKNKSNCNCQVYSELDWIISNDTVVRPDVMIVCGKFETDFLTFPPTLILEIISQSSRMRDRNTKFTLYEMCGVKYYLVADTDKESIEIYQLINNKYEQIQAEQFQLTEKCSVEIDLRNIWQTYS
jgi:Uma2 family endonuclease